MLDALLAGMVAGCVLACVQHLLVWVEAKSSLNQAQAHSQPSPENLRTHLQGEMMAGCVLVLDAHLHPEQEGCKDGE